MSNLSGEEWWRKHQASYPNSRDVNDLAPEFQQNAVRFIGLLRDGGAGVQVSSTRRNAIRAYLMHYSWRVAHNEIDASDVPSMKGVSIQWDHDNAEASISAARQMVDLFNLAYRPSLTSNHIRGLAIDMNIRWTGDLALGPLPDGSTRSVVDGPRNGADNRTLHEIGDMLSVRKLLSDPPHWSHNGR